MPNSKGYVTRLFTVQCSYTNDKKFVNYLNVETDHGVIWYQVDENGEVAGEYPFLNANDHIKDENILCLGRCTSPTNKVIGGDRCFHIGSLAEAIGQAFNVCDGYLCTPYTSRPWTTVVEDVLLDGAPMMMTECKLSCYYGGTITITEVPPEDAEES